RGRRRRADAAGDRHQPARRHRLPVVGAQSRRHRSTHVKLAAELSLPAAPVNFGHFGYSQSGRVRLAFGLASIAVTLTGALPFSTQSRRTPRLSNFALNTPKPWPRPGTT